MQPLVSIIIPTRNRKAILDDCLRSVYRSTYRNVEIIVVDNASSDGTVEMLLRRHGSGRLIRNGENRFAASARNAGLRAASGDYFLLLDDDNVIHPRLIESLLRLCASDDRIGLVGPKMYYYGTDRLLIFTGARIDLLTSKCTYRGKNMRDGGQYDEPMDTEHVSNVFLMSRTVYERIGCFDEAYRMTYAESDLAMRAARAGFRVMYCPAAVTHHRIAPPGGVLKPFKGPMRAYYLARNRVMYMKRFSTPRRFRAFMLFFYPMFTLYYLWMTLRAGDFVPMRMHLRGTMDGFLFGVSGVLRDAYSRPKV